MIYENKTNTWKFIRQNLFLPALKKSQLKAGSCVGTSAPLTGRDTRICQKINRGIFISRKKVN